MRSYSVAFAAFAIAADEKWLDNLLSQHPVPGVTRTRRGVAREISPAALLLLAVARRLVRDLDLPVGRAVELAAALVDGTRGEVVPAAGLQVRIDRPAIERDLTRRLADAAEMIAPRRRGRPPAGHRACGDS